MSILNMFFRKNFGPMYLYDRAFRLNLRLDYNVSVKYNGIFDKIYKLTDKTNNILIESKDERNIINKLDELEFGLNSNIIDLFTYKYKKLYLKNQLQT